MELAARQYTWPGGAAGWTNPYVTDGLIAMWDGEWNDGFGTHDPNATKWKDLCGTNDLTIYGTVHNNYVESQTTTAAESDFVINNIKTCEVCFVFTGSSNAGASIVFYSGNIETYRIGLVLRLQGNIGVQSYSNIFWSYAPIVNKNVLHTVSATTSNSYVDAVELNPVSSSVDRWSNGNRTAIGGRQWQNNWKTYGKFHCVRLYSRALTAAEIAANYAVDKARFNLTAS